MWPNRQFPEDLVYHATFALGKNLHSVIAWMSKESFVETGPISET